jgi:hypothetical protein
MGTYCTNRLIFYIERMCNIFLCDDDTKFSGYVWENEIIRQNLD